MSAFPPQLGVGKLDDALASANNAVRIAPNYYRGWWLLGWVRAQRGQHADAEATCRTAIKLNPHSRDLSIAAEARRHGAVSGGLSVALGDCAQRRAGYATGTGAL